MYDNNTDQKYPKNPNTVQKYAFLAESIGKCGAKRKDCQQNRGKWARETKQAT